jgi:hypothetical protein
MKLMSMKLMSIKLMSMKLMSMKVGLTIITKANPQHLHYKQLHILFFFIMARGPAFTIGEDNMLRVVWDNETEMGNRMVAIGEYIDNNEDYYFPPLRSYAAYRRRMFILSNNTAVDPVIEDPVMIPVVEDPVEEVLMNKRRVCEMESFELERYEIKVLDKIKRRREVLLEETMLPTCPVCCEMTENSIIAACGHVFCVQCYCSTLSRALPRYEQRCHVCPVCRANWDKPSKVSFMKPESTIAECKIKGAFISV